MVEDVLPYHAMVCDDAFTATLPSSPGRGVRHSMLIFQYVGSMFLLMRYMMLCLQRPTSI